MHTDHVAGDVAAWSPGDVRPERPQSIVHVVSPGAAGGLETVVRALATGHAAGGHLVRVVSVADDAAGQEFLGRFAGTGVETESLGIRGRGYRREREAARSLFRAIRPDIVHTHGNRPDVVDAPAARALGIGTVTTVHGYTASSARNRLYGYVQRLSLSSFDAVVAVSRPLAEQLSSHVEASRLELIPNAFIPGVTLFDRITARRRLGVLDGRFLIGWVGRMSPEKGPDVAVSAMSRLVHLAGSEPIELAMIGDGPQRTKAREIARRKGITRLVRWHGIRTDAPQLMAAFDLLIVTSRTEGTPMVVLEAMAAGTPIIATRVGGIPDMLSSDEALLVPSDDPGALATAMLGVLSGRDLAFTRARRAAESVNTKFDGSAWLDQYTALYERVRIQAERRKRC